MMRHSFITRNSELGTRNLAQRQDSKPETRNCSGFTLLEVLIALAILSITLIALSRSQSQSISVTGDSRSITTLTLLANAKMAEVESGTSFGNANEKGDFGTDFPEYAWEVKIENSGNPNLKKIGVETRDKRKSKGGVYKLLLYKYVPQ